MAPIDCSLGNLPNLDYSRYLQDGADLPGHHERSVDVVVIGTGAGGAAAAYQLAKTSGLEVLMLESGPYVPLRALNHNLMDMMAALAWDDANAGAADGSFRALHGRCVGGSTIMHMLTMTPLRDFNFSTWRDQKGIDLTAEGLQPYVDELKALMGIKPIERVQVNANAEPWIAGCDALGYLWRLNERNAGNCIGAGRCHTGCPFGGKLSMDVTLVPQAMNHGASLLTRAHVTKITTAEGRATGVEAQLLAADGRPHGSLRVRSRFVVTAAGAIQTPALLLRSGLQNPHGGVGSRLCAQPGINVLGMMPQPIHGWRGITNPIHIDEWADEGPGGFFIEPGMLDASIMADFIPGAGQEHADRMARYQQMTAGQILYCDSGETNRVTWEAGRANVEFNLAAFDHGKMRRAMQLAAEILLAGGAREVYLGQRRPLVIRGQKDLGAVAEITFAKHDFHFESVHAHGSCPMAVRPEDGVVDERGMCFHVAGLAVADASILPGPICANTTIPAATMGMMVADHVSREVAG